MRMIRCRSGEIYNSKNKYVNKSTYMTVYRSRHLKKSLFQLFGFWYACVVKRLPFGLQKATYSDGSDLQNAGDENTQGSLSSDSHGLAYFHLRRYISCRRKEITGIYQTFLLLRVRRYMLFSHGSLSFFPTVRYFYTAMNLSANFILSISTSRSIIGWVTFA